MESCHCCVLGRIIAPLELFIVFIWSIKVNIFNALNLPFAFLWHHKKTFKIDWALGFDWVKMFEMFKMSAHKKKICVFSFAWRITMLDASWTPLFKNICSWFWVWGETWIETVWKALLLGFLYNLAFTVREGVMGNGRDKLFKCLLTSQQHRWDALVSCRHPAGGIKSGSGPRFALLFVIKAAGVKNNTQEWQIHK